MFCKQCGKEIADGVAFCPSCGAAVSGDAPAPAPVRVKTPPVGGPLESGRANPLFFAAVICMSVVVFFQIISSLMNVADAPLVALVGLCGVAISGVILAGLWLAWTSGLDGTKAKLMGTGLKMIWGGVLGQLILGGIVLGLADIVLLIAAVAGGSFMGSSDMRYAMRDLGLTGLGDSLVGIMIVAFLICAALTALVIIYYIKVLKTVKLAQVSDATGKLAGVPSMFVAVVTFIMGGFTVLSMLGSLMGGDVVGMLSNMANAGANILFGIVMVQFRNQNAAAV